MLVPLGPLRVTLLKVETVPEAVLAFVVTQTFPPVGAVVLFGPGPSVVA